MHVSAPRGETCVCIFDVLRQTTAQAEANLMTAALAKCLAQTLTRHAQGLAALSLCTAAHPLHTRIAIIFGASISEAKMRPNPRHHPLTRTQGAAASTPQASMKESATVVE